MTRSFRLSTDQMLWNFDQARKSIGEEAKSDNELLEEIAVLKVKLAAVEKSEKQTKRKFIDVRLAAANAEAGVEQLQAKRAIDQAKLRELLCDKTKLEAEFYRVNDKLAEAVNAMNEIEIVQNSAAISQAQKASQQGGKKTKK